MAFCPNCGRQIEDESKGCPICDAKPETNPLTSKNNGDFGSAPVNPNKSQTKNIAIILGGVVAFILVIVLLVSVAGGKPYEKAIDNYFDVFFSGEVEKIKSLAPEAYWEYMEDEYDLDLDDYIEDMEDEMEDYLEEMEDEFGKKAKVTYKITDADRLDEDDLKDLKDTMKDDYDISKKSVTDAYELELEVTIKGEDDEDDAEMDVIVVKIDGKWYMTDEHGSFISF